MDDDGFIGLPPGMAPIDPNSGTVRRDRPDRPRAAEREEIVFFPVGAAPVAPPVPEPEPEPSLEPAPALDEETRVSAPRRHAASAWHVVVDGRSVPVEGLLYLGRNPVAGAAHPGAPVLAIVDSTKSVSKTHALLEVEGGTLWVHDLDSTNGVWVIGLDGEPREVLPGERAEVPAGGSVELGEFTIPVEHG
ncbi:hypothetical protein BH09ACT5_BH09ACT5_16360 [soil metagenome]